MTKFTKDTKLSELLSGEKYQEVLAKHRVPCITCPMAKFEMEKLKIGQIAEMYGIELEKLLKELNQIK